MSNQEQFQALIARIDALEQREKQLTYASHAYQAILLSLIHISEPTRH